MPIRVDDDFAERAIAALREAAQLDVGSDGFQGWYSQFRDFCLESKRIKNVTYPVALFTALAAKATEPSVNTLSLKSSDSAEGAYNARGLASKINEEASNLGLSFGVSGADPMNNSPFNKGKNYAEIARQVEPPNDGPFGLLRSLLDTLNATTERADAVVALGAFFKAHMEVFPDASPRRAPSGRSKASRPSPRRPSGPLNLILYGPPGTGKSHKTLELAVRICDGEASDDREAVVARYRELRRADRVEFVTFHQSFGYEEFVEGIRPVTQAPSEATRKADEGHGIRYEVTPGVFKTICGLAGGSARSKGAKGTVDVHSARFWKMSLGNTQDPEQAAIYEACIEGGYLRLGYGHGLDYSACKDRAAVLAKVKAEADPEATGTDIHVSTVNALKNKMKDGDLVIVSDGNYKFRAIGQVRGPYEFHEDDEYQQRRPVTWLAVYEESQPRERISSKIFSQRTLYQPDREGLKLDAIAELLREATGEAPAEPKNYVLIIDEINRGNVSKILGELITLLEEDKRIGARNQLRAKLPYSGDDFGVPPNVYLIGTMNTADRSIAFLDTALRRRFEFDEVMPDSDVLRRRVGNDGVVSEVDVAGLLDRLNERVELLYDRDHQIGHAYFIDVHTLEDLRRVFVMKVIPLLTEYFYGDWEKLCHVLGCPFNPEDAQPLSQNKHPVIQPTLLSTSALLAGDPGFESKLRCEISTEFLSANDEGLVPFFAGIAGSESE